jgi:hypothetical protein
MRHGQQVDPDQQRQIARDILNDRRFHRSPAPQPLRGPLQWLGDRLRNIYDAAVSALRALPGPTWVAVAFLALVVLLVAVVLLARSHRVAGLFGERALSPGSAAREDPAALERAADAAERAGDYTDALRLRFRAGLLRLDERGAIHYRPSLTTVEVRHLLGDVTFDELAARFEEVAYGGDAAAASDVSAARDGWRHVLDAATPQ